MKKDTKLTDEEIRKIVDTNAKKFMKAARKFLAAKSGGTDVPTEWEISMIMLETYYKEFLHLTIKIEQLDSLTIQSRYGEAPNPILTVRDRAAARLESLLKQMGMTMKSSVSMGAVEPQREITPLDTFLKKQIEKR